MEISLSDVESVTMVVGTPLFLKGISLYSFCYCLPVFYCGRSNCVIYNFCFQKKRRRKENQRSWQKGWTREDSPFCIFSEPFLFLRSREGVPEDTSAS